MAEHHIQLVINAAKQLGLNIKTYEDEFGNVVIEQTEKIDLYNKFKKLISEQIDIKNTYLGCLEKRILKLSDNRIEKWRLKDEALNLQREILDLSVEYMSKEDWIFHYSRHLEYHKQQSAILILKAKEELPELIRQANEIAGSEKLLTKESAIISGLLSRYYKGFKNDNEIITFYTDIKNRLELYRQINEHKDK